MGTCQSNNTVASELSEGQPPAPIAEPIAVQTRVSSNPFY